MQLIAQSIDENTVHLLCTKSRCFHYIEIVIGQEITMEDIISWYADHQFVSHSEGNLAWPTADSIWH